MKNILVTSMLFIAMCSSQLANGQSTNSIVTTIDPVGYVKAEPSENSTTIAMANKGDKVEISRLFYKAPYLKVRYGETEGYISLACLSLSCEVLEIIYKHTNRNEECHAPTITDSRSESNSPSKKATSTNYSTSDCHKTANCGCSGKRKAECGGSCCVWIVNHGCNCR